MAWRMSLGVDADEQAELPGTGEVLRRTAAMLGPYRTRTLLAASMLIAWTLLTLAGPLLVRRAIDLGLREGDRAELWRSVVLYVVAACGAYVTYRLSIRNLANVGEGFLRDLRNQAFRRLQSQSLSFYDRMNSGVVVSRMTSDIDSLQDLVQFGLLMFVSAGLLLILSTIVLATLSLELLLLCLLVAPIVAAATVKFQRDSNRAYLAVRDSVGSTLHSLQEGISGVRIVQAFAREEIEAGRFAATNRRLYETHMDSVRVAAWYLPIVEAAGALATAITLGVGGWWVATGRITLGTVAAFVLILQSLLGPVQQLSQLLNLVQSANASLAKVFGLMDEPVEVTERADPVELNRSGRIELDGVGFRYGDGPAVLAGIDLTITEGERLALVGPTGAGKSTVAKLVARFYDATDGSVRIGGTDVRSASLASLRRQVVVVPQEGYLFTGSVRDNIRLARPDASDDDVVAAVDRIGATGIFDGLVDGLDTEVQERGSRLSAGERQIVSLARAALVDPAVLILDEATSSVDPGTESLVEGAMDSLMRARTVIVIAHRLSTAARCDRVGVVLGGRLVELGSHDELVAAGGHYAGLFDAWSRTAPA
ncbi:MAG: ABC transporter ATP-binding protein [Actinomycetota bacterium]